MSPRRRKDYFNLKLEGLEDLLGSGEFGGLEEFEKDVEASENNWQSGLEENFDKTFEAVFEQAFGFADINFLGSEMK